MTNNTNTNISENSVEVTNTEATEMKKVNLIKANPAASVEVTNPAPDYENCPVEIDWEDAQDEKWRADAKRDENGRFFLIEDADYKNIEKNPGWRPTYSILLANGKTQRVGRNWGEFQKFEAKLKESLQK